MLPAKRLAMLYWFCLMTMLLFLSDGIGESMNTFFIPAIGMMGLYVRMYVGNRKPHDRAISLAWGAFIVSIILSTLTSVHLGASIEQLPRYLAGYLVFDTFRVLSSDESLKDFRRAVGIMGAFMVIFDATGLFYSIFRIAPDLNVFASGKGHSLVIHMVVFLFPDVWQGFVRREKYSVYILWAITFIVFVSWSRAGVLVVTMYIVYQIIHAMRTNNRSLIVVRSLMILVTTFMAFSLIIHEKGLPSPFIDRARMKSQFFQAHIQYWGQAVDAFVEKPLLGNGTGTFFYLSKMHQRSQSAWSIHAHNYLLQVLSETGVVGLFTTITLGAVLLSVVRRNSSGKAHSHTYSTTLLEGTVLVVLYNLFDFTLHLTVYWFMFWSVIGLLVGSKERGIHEKMTTSPVPYVGVILAGYLLMVMISTVYLEKGSTGYAYVVAPFRREAALRRIQHFAESATQIPGREEALMNFFFERDPEIHTQLARMHRNTDNISRSIIHYNMAISADPHNNQLYTEYFQILANNSTTTALGEAVETHCNRIIPGCSPNTSRGLFSNAYVLEALHSLYRNNEIEGVSVQTLPFALYVTGYYVINQRPDITNILWEYARDAVPTLGYYHVELASLQYHTFNSYSEAAALLNECTKIKETKQQCSDTVIEHIPQPGHYFRLLLGKNE